MMHFEKYHWEDHVPRAGSWKLNLAVGVLALGLIAAAMPDNPVKHADDHATNAKPLSAANFSAPGLQRGVQPAALIRQAGRSTPCPHTDS
jgi:hypothetical protein